MKPFFHHAFRGRFGVVRRDITPPVGILSRNWGAATSDVADALHRPFTLTALTIQDEQEGEPLAIVTMDLGWWRSPEELASLSEAVRSTGITRFLLAPTHTHAGPCFSPALKDKPGGEFIAPYLELIARTIQEAVREAWDKAIPGLWETADGTCGLAGNRDLPEPGSGRLLVGWNPEKPGDETLLFARISDNQGACLATVLNYACHPTILAWENRTLSPDFVGATREVVEGATKAPCLFLQGASGDLAPRHQYVGDPEIADRAGRSLGHAALGVFHGMLPIGQELIFTGAVASGAPLARWETRVRSDIPADFTCRTVQVELALKPGFPTTKEIEEQIKSESHHVELERLQRSLGRRRLIGEGTRVVRSHHLWRLGGVIFVSVPDEIFSALQIELRKAAHPLPVFVITLANGSNGYVSPAHSFEENSYAADVSPYAKGCFEQTLNVLVSEIKKLL